MRESPGAVSVLVTGEHLDELAAQPGQFFRWRFLTRGPVVGVEPVLALGARRPADAALHGQGPGRPQQRARRGCAPGTRVFAEGPYGTFTGRPPHAAQVLLIAAGVGITPLRALFEIDLGLARRARADLPRERPAKVLFRRELEAIAAARQAKLDIIVGSRAQLRGDPLSARRRWPGFPASAEHDIYLCGPDEMEAGVIARAALAGRPAPPDPHRIVHVLSRESRKPSMRRVILAVTSTVAVLVLLLGFKSQSAPSVTKPAASACGLGQLRHGRRHVRARVIEARERHRYLEQHRSTTGTKTVTGDSADTRYGPVQVKVTATNGKITRSTRSSTPRPTRATRRSTASRSRS